jgi:nitric oxide reductase subunit B
LTYKRLWIALAAVIVLSFSVLGWFGREIYRQAPPLPERVVNEDGEVLFTKQEILDGQNVWQSMGGQQIGSVWGHGAYLAPDWSADWLRRESLWLLDYWARDDGAGSFAALSSERQAALRERLLHEIRRNTHDQHSGEVILSRDRSASVRAMMGYYQALFGDAAAFPASTAGFSDNGMTPDELRHAYAIAKGTLSDPERQRLLGAFFFWAAWSCGTERPLQASAAGIAPPWSPGDRTTYTNNWPHEPLIGNRPSTPTLLWSVISVLVLLAGVGAMVWYYASKREEDALAFPAENPLATLTLSPSMRATLKYFWVVAALLGLQVLLGVVTAHYGVEGDGFYGIPLAQWLPYAVTRTWHLQLAVFWIATAWLATGLFVAPAVGGSEPRWQKLGVNALFGALVLVVAGSLFGTWYGTRQQLGLEANFWFGHQGYEYVELGRFWQIMLLVGLFLWLGLMLRALTPALRRSSEQRPLLVLFVISCAAIALFWGAGLMWGRQTHLSIAEYWRWWVVHLWVEGFFEVFATVVVAFIFSRLGLIGIRMATIASLLATTIFLAGGIIGTFHHLYFTGTPTSIMALGSVFSALEVVPLVLMGYEAVHNLRLGRGAPWLHAYRWPILFFVAVAFWNLVGAGLFGFLINPPIALYYMQGLNTTPVHGHAALFGVYGMLGLGLMLFCLRGLQGRRQWKDWPLSWSFWSLNIGLAAMVMLSLLPVGLMQTVASIEHGLWYARSAEFLQTPVMEVLRWLRAVGDIVFAVGVALMVWFVVGLRTGWSYTPERSRLTAPVAADEIVRGT